MDKPGVGVGVVVEKDNKVLLGLRIGKHGTNTWSFPGGKLDFMEKIEDCAVRETLEETGIKLTNVKLLNFFTEVFHKEENKHFVTVLVSGKTDQDPQVTEPDKFEKWEWFDWDNLPKPMFDATKNYVNARKT